MAKDEKVTEKAESVKTVEAQIVEVATQYGQAIQLPDGRKVDDVQLMVEIYNKLSRIEKSVA